VYLVFIVTVTKILTVFHSWIHPLHNYPFIHPPPLLEQFQQVSFHFHT
jgi:hypothetical protein